ncbi:MAG: DHHW family protein [Lachnoclostridium sp.]|nr:DHHW family protein [Lachnospira sp.]MCM1247997.1 DHHW family protein [Lachnoclostridium sp.]
MDEKKNSIFTIGIVAAILLAFAVADCFHGDRVFSETENRLLAKKPEFAREAFLRGDFGKAYENYLTDQFVSRDKWVNIKTRTDIFFRKKDINEVYLGKDDYLIERHLPENYSGELEDEKIALLGKLTDEWGARVMLVPTADNILQEKLPAYADYYDESRFLEKVRERVGERSYIDVYAMLEAHNEEEIYYRTDRHWTSLGAYYGYLVWTRETLSFLYPYNPQNMTTVSDDFRGDLISRIPGLEGSDTIQIFPETKERPVSITYDFKKTADSFYEESYLTGENPYGYFLDDTHGVLEIHTDYQTDRTLFLIKDSCANCMIPFLQPHYSSIYVVDLQYYSGSLSRLMESCKPEKGMDVLVLYDCIHFLEDFQYLE